MLCMVIMLIIAHQYGIVGVIFHRNFNVINVYFDVYCTPPVLGRDLLRRLIDSESTHSSAAASAVASVLQTFRHSKNCLKHLTSSSSAKLFTIDTTCYQVTSHLSH